MGAYCDYCGSPANAGSGICSSCALQGQSPTLRRSPLGTGSFKPTLREIRELNEWEKENKKGEFDKDLIVFGGKN